MPDRYYPGITAGDAASVQPGGTVVTAVVKPNASVQVFEISDTARANPVTLKSMSGLTFLQVQIGSLPVLPDLYVVSDNFAHIWKSGDLEFRRDSADAKDKAVAEAVAAAQAAVLAVPVEVERIAATGAFKGSDGLPGKDGSNVVPTATAILNEVTAGPARTAIEGVVVNRPKIDRDRLRKFREALEANNATVIVCGDSWTEGTRGADLPNLRYVDHLANAIRGAAVNSIGGTYIPSYSTYPTRLVTNWTYTGTVANRDVTGMGYYNKEMQVASEATLTLFGTGFRLHLDRRPDGATVEIRIDGVLQETYNSQNATTSTSEYRTYVGLVPANHTLKITVIAGSGTVFSLQGAYVYNGDNASGVRVYPAGRGGIKSDAMLNIAGQLSAVVPDLVVFGYSINDYRSAITPAAMRNNYVAGITAIRQRAPMAKASIVLLSFPEPAIAATPAVAPWAEYKAVIAEVAETYGCTLVDLTPVFGDGILDSTSPLVNTDRVHPNDPGHRAIASAIADAILPTKRITKPTGEQLWVPATSFVLLNGTPTYEIVNGTFPSWRLKPDEIGSVVCNSIAPAGWQTYDIDIWYANHSVGAGNIRLRNRLGVLPLGVGVSIAQDIYKTVPAGAQFIVQRSYAHNTNVTQDSNGILRIVIERTGTDAADTLPNDALFLGVMLRKTL